jgi:hypothetical protein
MDLQFWMGLQVWMGVLMIFALGLAVYLLELRCRGLQNHSLSAPVADEVAAKNLEEGLQVLEARLFCLEEITRCLLLTPSSTPAPDCPMGPIPKPSASLKGET